MNACRGRSRPRKYLEQKLQRPTRMLSTSTSVRKRREWRKRLNAALLVVRHELLKSLANAGNGFAARNLHLAYGCWSDKNQMVEAPGN